jgi:hypothetical protein
MQQCVRGRLTCQPGPRSPAAWGWGWPRRGRSARTLRYAEVGGQLLRREQCPSGELAVVRVWPCKLPSALARVVAHRCLPVEHEDNFLCRRAGGLRIHHWLF